MEIDGLSKTNCYSNGALADQLLLVGKNTSTEIASTINIWKLL